MDPKLSPVPRKAITPDRDGRNGHTWQTDNESAENFRRVVGQFIHGNHDHTSQIFQSSIDLCQPGSVATSVATSVASSRDSTLPQIVPKAETQDSSPPKGNKRAAESSTLSEKLTAQQMRRKRPPRATAISTRMINDTIQYLQTVSDHILISDTISSREWATMHLATQLLQSRYEDFIAREETEAVPDFHSAQAKAKDERQKGATVDEEPSD